MARLQKGPDIQTNVPSEKKGKEKSKKERKTVALISTRITILCLKSISLPTRTQFSMF